MLIDDDSLYLYHLTLKSPTSTSKSILGQFLGAKKSQELVFANTTFLELWKPNSSTGKIEKLSTQNTFGIIQSIDTVRLPGTQKDYLVITSDSGNIVIAEYNEETARFQPVVQEPHSKNGFRRITPGEYLSVDPHNRAILVSAIEKNKLVYKVSADKDGHVELSSPLEASSRELLTLQTCALDTNYDNPMFAAIEIDYSEYERSDRDSDDYVMNDADQLTYDPDTTPLLLNYYELDQGLNHIIKRKSSDFIPASSICLIPLPGHIGGVFVTCDSTIIYDHPQRDRISLPLPIRKGTDKTVITSHVTHKLKKNNFFILCQSTLGDLFKITVNYNEDREQITDISVKYFDTIPHCNNLNILKTGFLFANCTNNNKLFYQFEDLAEDDDETTLKSTDFQDIDFADIPLENRSFKEKGLEYIALVDIIESLQPIIDGSLLETTNQHSPDPLYQITTLSSHSHLKTLTHGIPTSTIVSEPCPQIIPTAVFTTKMNQNSTNDDYLILTSSLSSETLVFSIGEDIDLIDDSQFVADQTTIAVQQVGRSSIIQVHSDGIRHIKHVEEEDGKFEKKVTDWATPGGIAVLKASTNNEQVIIGLSNREVRYFEIDSVDDQLKEYEESMEVTGGNVTSLAICPTTIGGRKSSFAIIGSSDESVQVISLLEHNLLEVLTLQALSANSSSLQILPHGRNTYVHIGMENGLYVRTLIDDITGKLSGTIIKYLGSRPVQLSPIGIPQLNQTGLLAISSKPWIVYHTNSKFKTTPLLDLSISSGVSLFSDALGGEGIVGIANNNLTILTVGGGEESGFDVNNDFTISNLELRYTPKRMVTEKSDANTIVYVIESEYGIKSPYPMTPLIPSTTNENTDANLNSGDQAKEVDQTYYDAFGYEKSEGSWASCIQVVDLSTQAVLQSIELSDNRATCSITQIEFTTSHPNKKYLAVGVTQNQKYLPNTSSKNYIYTFEIIRRKKESTPSLKFIHQTSIAAPPTAIIAFHDKLLVGFKNHLNLYDLGQRQLLRKATSSISHLTQIVKLVHQGGNVIVVGDAHHSTTFVKYDNITNQFLPFCDDIMQRQITAMTTLDANTIIGGDKFGNCFVSRLSKPALHQLNDDWTLRYQDSYLNASGTRLRNLCEFYLQDIPTSFSKGTLVVGGMESVYYTGLQGTIGMIMPVATKSEIELLCKLEVLLREYFTTNFDDFDKEKHGYNLLGKDHLKFRSYYNPVKNVIDGDFVERYHELSVTSKIKIATELDRTPRELEKKISDLRYRSAF